MDPLTTGALAVLGYTSKDVLTKLLGPTAEYMGGGLKDWTQKRVGNVKNIFDMAARKLGSKLEIKGPSVPPRVLDKILNEGSYCDDKLTAEYFAGVLASSRTGVRKDDRGSFFASTVSRLSSYQIRSHYILYSVLKKVFNGSDIDIGTERFKLKVFLPLTVYQHAMSFEKDEDVDNLTLHSLIGLNNEGLIDDDFVVGDLKYLKSRVSEACTSNGIVFTASGFGIELYLWAHGKSDVKVTDFLNKENQFIFDMQITIMNGAYSIATNAV